MRIGRLFIGARRCNERHRFVIASWTYATGYWRWALYWSAAGMCMPHFGGAYKFMPRPWFRRFTPDGSWPRGWVAVNLAVPFVGRFNLSTQPEMEGMKR